LAFTISFGNLKGGVGKTTTTAITSWILSQEARVLAVDFDSQGNLTTFLTQSNIYNFTKKTVLEAMKAKDARPYIHEVNENLHVLPAEDFLATFSRHLFTTRGIGNVNQVLRKTLLTVKDRYDYILIDLPPNLGDHTINGLTASDYAVVMLQCEPFCYDALERYLEFLDEIKKTTNNDLVLAGILTSMMNSRTTLDAAILEKAREEFKDIVFTPVIKRRSRLKEFSLQGIQRHTKVDIEALAQYYDFVEELINRVQQARVV
jgi:chromosome partitioning protein